MVMSPNLTLIKHKTRACFTYFPAEYTVGELGAGGGLYISDSKYRQAE